VTKGEWLHWLGGLALGLPSRLFSLDWRKKCAERLEAWAFEREQRQNEAGENPNEHLNERQIAEAKAWRAGYEVGAGLSGVG
jgi:hypothetical protein